MRTSSAPHSASSTTKSPLVEPFPNLPRVLGENRHVSLLEQTKQEEKETDEKLTEFAKEINPQANQVKNEGEEEENPKSGRRPARRVA